MSAKQRAKLKRAVRAAPPRPWRFTPPKTTKAQPDRNKAVGLSGDISFGDVASGSGAFIAAAEQVGMKCAWFIEPDDTTAAIAARVAGPQATRYRSVLDLNPWDLPWVQALLAGPECTPFSKAGKQRSFQDKRSKTLFWTIWFMSERQPDFAFIENVAALKTVKGGDVWRTLVSLVDVAGYHLHHDFVCPTMWGIPETRKRVMLLAIRKDLYAKVGAPPPLRVPRSVRHRSLEDIMLPPAQVSHYFEAHKLWANVTGSVAVWKADWQDKLKLALPGQPFTVLRYGQGNYGYTAFANATPATKHSSFGPGGNTHLVVQQDAAGVWAPRNLSPVEMKLKFDGDLYDVPHPAPVDHPDLMAILGNSCPMDVLVGILTHYVSNHLRIQ